MAFGLSHLYFFQEVSDDAVYNFPQMGKTDFSYTAQSDILLRLIEDEKQIRNLLPCIMQYKRTKDGMDYVKAFPISVKDDVELMPWLEKALNRMNSACVFYSSVDDIHSEEDNTIRTLGMEVDWCPRSFV